MLATRLATARGRAHWPRVLATAAEQYDLIQREPGALSLTAYTETGFIVNGEERKGGVCILANKLLPWAPRAWSEVTPESLALLQQAKKPPELLVLGCGRFCERVGAELQTALEERGCSIEAADTPNALATFNVLSQEGRSVAAALLPLSAEERDEG